MDYQDILVHIDNAPQCATRLRLAVKLAERHHAYLTGLYVVAHSHYSSADADAETRAAAAKEIFRKQTAALGANAAWLAADWTTSGLGMAQIINRYAHKKDLIVVGQGEPGASEADVPHDLAERVVQGSGRPVLVVPYAGTFDHVGERVIVAWKEGRASARALGDAMPLLKRAQQVCVLTIETPGGPRLADLPGDDLATHLRRLRVNMVQENLETAEIPVADVLTGYAWENGYDLIVMGAYAQPPRGPLAVGPVARDLFQRMTAPVLMSH